MDWKYFDKFDPVCDRYLPGTGEGETMATQMTTAVSKLVYKWFNDGDVYDNTYYLNGWCNDLSSYANWLARNITGAKAILDGIVRCYSEEAYSDLLAQLADKCLSETYLAFYDEQPKTGSVYECDGDYRFEDADDDEEENEYW